MNRRYRYDNRRHSSRRGHPHRRRSHGYGRHPNHHNGRRAYYTIILWVLLIVAIGSGALEITGV